MYSYVHHDDNQDEDDYVLVFTGCFWGALIFWAGSPDMGLE